MARVMSDKSALVRCRKSPCSPSYHLGFSMLVVLGVEAAAMAQHAVDWSSIDGGGATTPSASVDGWEIVGTLGQPDARTSTMRNTSYELVGGFWSFNAVIPCPGDVTGDQEVSLVDLSVQLANFGRLSGATLADGDLDGDGDVDLTDLATLLSRFGTTCL